MTTTETRHTGKFLAASAATGALSVFFYVRSWVDSFGDYGAREIASTWGVFSVICMIASVICAVIALVAIGDTIDLRHNMLVDEWRRLKFSGKSDVPQTEE